MEWNTGRNIVDGEQYRRVREGEGNIVAGRREVVCSVGATVLAPVFGASASSIPTGNWRRLSARRLASSQQIMSDER